MEQDDVTMVMDPVPEGADAGGPQTPDGAGAPPEAPGPGGPAKLPAWAVAAVVALGLLLIGGGAYLATRNRADVGSEAVLPEVAASEAAVPDVRGMTLDRAGDEVLAAGLEAGTIAYAIVEESVAPSGTVLSQDPLPGTKVALGSAVDIVLAQAPQEAVAEILPDTGTPGEGDAQGGSGSNTGPGAGSTTGGSGSAPSVPPTLPDLPAAESIDITKLQPLVMNPGIFKLVQPTYRTVVEHEGFDANPWTSPALTFGAKPKRIIITAAGPYNQPIAVWAWGPGDSDWVLKTIWFSYPGAYENLDGSGGTWVGTFNVAAGTNTVLVKLGPGVTWWKVQIQEQE